MKTLEQLNSEIKKLREDFNKNRDLQDKQDSFSRESIASIQNKEMSEMEKRQDLERQKRLLKDLISLGIVKENK